MGDQRSQNVGDQLMQKWAQIAALRPEHVEWELRNVGLKEEWSRLFAGAAEDIAQLTRERDVLLKACKAALADSFTATRLRKSTAEQILVAISAARGWE